jgi:hypothetical protein
MTKAELYRQVFNAPGGHDVLADLASLVKHMDPKESGSAGRLISHIQQHLFMQDPPEKKARNPMKASGGRIAHG